MRGVVKARAPVLFGGERVHFSSPGALRAPGGPGMDLELGLGVNQGKMHAPFNDHSFFEIVFLLSPNWRPSNMEIFFEMIFLQNIVSEYFLSESRGTGK